MKDLHPQFELLISYADGLADAEMIKQAEALISTDAEAAEFYQSLQATALAYEDLYAEPVTAPQQVIDAIRKAQPDEFEHPAFADDTQANITPIESTRSKSTSVEAAGNISGGADGVGGYGNLALAASLICGLIGGAVIYGSVAGTSSTDYQNPPVATRTDLSDSASDAVHDGVSDTVPEWVRLVADYHRLYVRETVTVGVASSAETVSKQVSETLQTDFAVPALEESHGMEFRRAQWLAIDEQPLLQLAYLPESGKPLAVCVLKKATAETTAAEYGEADGMQYVHWQSGKHAVVVVGTVSQPVLREIHSIVERELL